MSFKIGAKFRYPDGTLYHLRGIVDGVLIMRFWVKHKKRWSYQVKCPVDIEIGLLKPV